MGREKDELQDNWFLVLLNPYHNGHGREDITFLRKPKRLRSDIEVQLAKDVIDSYGESGVASSLYYHRTGARSSLIAPTNIDWEASFGNKHWYPSSVPY